jgi:FtsZ-interacting cell division protein ZipA
MPELRWTLLIIGGLFVVGLALWEIRRQRQAPRQNRVDSGGPSMEAGSSSGSSPSSVGFGDGSRVRNEPVITLPELQPMDGRGEPRMSARREPTPDPPIVEVDDAAFSRLQEGAAGSTDPEIAYTEDTIALTAGDESDLDADLRDAVARRAGLGGSAAHAEDAAEVDGAEPATRAAPDYTVSDLAPSERAASQVAARGGASARAAPDHGASDAAARAASQSAARGEAGPDAADAGSHAAGAGSSSSARTSSHVAPSEAASFAASANADVPADDAATHGADEAPPSESVGFATDTDDQHTPAPRPLEAHPRPAHEAAPAGATAAGAPVVDWPTETSRKIVALRLVSQPAARFQGRAVRQALAAEGFVLGKFDIFHKAGPDDRAVLSAASLTKPGTFAMNTIDGQRFGGISLFAVLPGPLPPQETFDELLHTARALNDRLQGALQDERGEPLTPMRSASIRQSLSEGNGSTGSGASAEPLSETRQ